MQRLKSAATVVAVDGRFGRQVHRYVDFVRAPEFVAFRHSDGGGATEGGVGCVALGFDGDVCRTYFAVIGKVKLLGHYSACCFVRQVKRTVAVDCNLDKFVFQYAVVAGNQLAARHDLRIVLQVGLTETKRIGFVTVLRHFDFHQNAFAVGVEFDCLGVHFAFHTDGDVVARKLYVGYFVALFVHDVVEVANAACASDADVHGLTAALGCVDDNFDYFLAAKRQGVEYRQRVVGGKEVLCRVDLAVQRHTTTVGNFLGNGLCQAEVVHHVFVRTVYSRTANAVVSVTFQQVLPCAVEVGARVFLAESFGVACKRLGNVE